MLSEFVDREEERRVLAARLASAQPQLIRVYGRRRVGKTELLRHVVPERRSLFLTADEAAPVAQLAAFSGEVARQARVPPRPYADWDEFLDHVEELRPRVLVLDEFQRVLEGNRACATRLQRRWDHGWRLRGPHLVLCGSSIGMMERLTHRAAAPLHGRLTADLRVRAFDYRATRLLYPKLSEEERVRRYAVFGGTPFYHTFSRGQRLEAAVRRAFLERDAPLADEPPQLLRLEVHSPGRYQSVLVALGQGLRQLADLESKLRVRPGGLSPYLQVLRNDLDLVRAEVPVGARRSRTRYAFADPFFEFYYRFIFPGRASRDWEPTESAWRRISAELDSYVGRVFERVAREAFLALRGGSVEGHAVEFDTSGPWWNRTGEEIDLVLVGVRSAWAGEVKWTGDPVDRGVVDRLLDKIPRLDRVPRTGVRPFVVSRAGLTPSAAERLAEAHGVALDLRALTAVFSRHRTESSPDRSGGSRDPGGNPPPV